MAVHILNQSLTQSVEGRTPHEVWYGFKPSVEHFRKVGCVAHVKQGAKHLSKLEDRSTPMVFIGYEHGSKAWRFYNPATKRVVVSRDAIFEESQAWDWSDAENIDGENPFYVDFIQSDGDFQLDNTPFRETDLAGPSRSPPTAQHMPVQSSADTPGGTQSMQTPAVPNTVEFATPPIVTPNLDADHGDAPCRYRNLESIMNSGNVQVQNDMGLVEELLAIMGNEPAISEEVV
jgi:hypothetical protein